MTRNPAQVLVSGRWKDSRYTGTFTAYNPASGEPLDDVYPVSSRDEVMEAVAAGSAAASELGTASALDVAAFLEAYARAIEDRAGALVEVAHSETGLPASPRLGGVELPRTTDQLRQAAAAARDGAWRQPVRDEPRNIFAVRAPLGGPVVVMGPNNFPFAFNSVSGGDFAAAIAAQNPVIAKANPGHPGTTRLLAEAAAEAVSATGLPDATVQMIYEMPRPVGMELAGHKKIGAVAFTGSRSAGLQLKAAADRAGKPIYLEMSSVNPVVLLDGALRERGEQIAAEFFASCTMGTGQFCTNPGVVVVPDTAAGRQFLERAREQFLGGAPGVLLTRGGRDHLVEATAKLQQSGATLLCGGSPTGDGGYRFSNTLLEIGAADFLRHSEELQIEAFGPVSLVITAESPEQMAHLLEEFEGNLTGTIYTGDNAVDDYAYGLIEPVLRRRVGRLINNRMPTGVAVSPAMVHGGPFPSTGHPGFTAVGIPASIERFTALHGYDNVRPDRLPAVLRD